ncbi:polymorphic toxin-type HINT domain-containing protein [Tuwongella immobilis]|uniref:Hint domain-containing protein n=1 Tax=Tuwongella immobilis TaxID=692036 RepID=A0A6C2YL39_9BACT|nr:polymorphic toxin-type HINT domain-containing protein [Tuwongella immobilis]VIP02087.1 YD repeat protein OS=Isosphaera pallida (strain ATCC 43644 / DSM 9630 / IS1B) GN=Isop_2419 PE=4 SV=1: PT-HINT [Tuwongella immobilis]VTS00347.1 YD repeat protein OS=Isosphaera pallida (strain ATCC 43644 / DSM 9630 / IS1B) GN=Isop_2419 PE=4 SV=1: PT-HINT [Tuwongella immobilis]
MDLCQCRRAIEQFVPGDAILSRDEHDLNGPIEVQIVEFVFERSPLIFELRVAGQFIETTAEHPFWVVNRGWTPVWELTIGDSLTTITGETVSVEGVHETDRRQTVYNLRVAEFHTYFVGCDEWGFSVWAHNVDCGDVWRAIGGKGEVPEAAREAVNRVTEAVNRGASKTEVRDLLKQIPDGPASNSKALPIADDLLTRPKTAAPAPKPATPAAPPRSPAGRLLEDEIAHHSQGHWPGESVSRIRQRVDEVIAGAQESHAMPNGHTIYRRGDTVVVVNTNRTEGTIFRPSNLKNETGVDIAKNHVRRWVEEGGR